MWTYEQKTGRLVNAAGALVATGYSGAPAGKNNPDMQNVQAVGPIPQGEYTVGTPFNAATHGPFAMHLNPYPSNEMFGRSGFLMHGDSLEHPGAASEGCIIMPRAIRETVWNSNDHRLQVVSGEAQ